MRHHRLPVVIIGLWVLVLAVFVFISFHSRMMADDYCTAYRGRESTPLQAVQYYYQTWTGRYSDIFVKSALAPLTTAYPFMAVCSVFGQLVSFNGMDVGEYFKGATNSPVSGCGGCAYYIIVICHTGEYQRTNPLLVCRVNPVCGSYAASYDNYGWADMAIV